MPLILSVGLVESDKDFGGESADDAHVGPTTTATATTATVSMTVSMIITSHGHYYHYT
jgi:hypothetical protein